MQNYILLIVRFFFLILAILYFIISWSIRQRHNLQLSTFRNEIVSGSVCFSENVSWFSPRWQLSITLFERLSTTRRQDNEETYILSVISSVWDSLFVVSICCVCVCVITFVKSFKLTNPLNPYIFSGITFVSD